MIQQAKQTVLTSCTLDIISGDLQIASNNSISTPPEFLWVNAGATLNAHSAKIYSNALNTNSGITILGRLKTSHPNGLYNATTNATFSTTLTDNLEYYLTPSSIIEYNGTANQIVTGIGIGRAISFNHKYGVLDINFQGVANTDFAYPSNVPNDSCVYIRTNLTLTNGEFNLDDDHNPANGGGRKITLESGFLTAMQRSAGYVRSEVEDGSGMSSGSLVQLSVLIFFTSAIILLLIFLLLIIMFQELQEVCMLQHIIQEIQICRSLLL